MTGKLFETPDENLNISTPELFNAIMQEVNKAKLSGEWRYPFKEAATELDEMSLEDMAYWVYKCQNPVLYPEKTFSETIQTDNNIIKLPLNFRKEHQVTFAAAGDLLRSAGIDHSKNRLYEHIHDILFDQDISYANWETAITRQPLKEEVIGDKEPPLECAHKEHFDILAQHNGKKFSILNTANNHIFDMGMEGLETTQALLSAGKIINTGTNEMPEDAKRGQIFTCNNIRIGLVSYTFGLNGHQLPPGEEYRINVAKLLSKTREPELEAIKNQIDFCKEEDCDFIIASMHWGYEFEMFPRKKQIDIAHKIVEYGADAIISHHPHVIQPVEYYQTSRDPERIATIAYSLGSLTWGYTAPHLALSLIQNLKLAQGTIKGKRMTYIEEAHAIPVFRNNFMDDGNLITRIEKLNDYRDNSSDYINKIRNYARVVLDRDNILG